MNTRCLVLAIALLTIPAQQYAMDQSFATDLKDNLKVIQQSKAIAQNKVVQAKLALTATTNNYNDTVEKGLLAGETYHAYLARCEKAAKHITTKKAELEAAKKEYQDEEKKYLECLKLYAQLSTTSNPKPKTAVLKYNDQNEYEIAFNWENEDQPGLI